MKHLREEQTVLHDVTRGQQSPITLEPSKADMTPLSDTETAHLLRREDKLMQKEIL